MLFILKILWFFQFYNLILCGNENNYTSREKYKRFNEFKNKENIFEYLNNQNDIESYKLNTLLKSFYRKYKLTSFLNENDYLKKCVSYNMMDNIKKNNRSIKYTSEKHHLKLNQTNYKKLKYLDGFSNELKKIEMYYKIHNRNCKHPYCILKKTNKIMDYFCNFNLEIIEKAKNTKSILNPMRLSSKNKLSDFYKNEKYIPRIPKTKNKKSLYEPHKFLEIKNLNNMQPTNSNTIINSSNVIKKILKANINSVSYKNIKSNLEIDMNIEEKSELNGSNKEKKENSDTLDFNFFKFKSHIYKPIVLRGFLNDKNINGNETSKLKNLDVENSNELLQKINHLKKITTLFSLIYDIHNKYTRLLNKRHSSDSIENRKYHSVFNLYNMILEIYNEDKEIHRFLLCLYSEAEELNTCKKNGTETEKYLYLVSGILELIKDILDMKFKYYVENLIDKKILKELFFNINDVDL